MKKQIIILAIAFLVVKIGFSQTEKNIQDETIILKKGDDKEKLTIKIDGNKISINGKEMNELSEAELKALKLSSGKIKLPKESLTLFGLGEIHEKKARLGVMTEKANDGVVIQSIARGSAAEKAGLKEKDIIKKVDEINIDSPEKLANTIRAHQPLDSVTIHYSRDGKSYTTIVKLDQLQNEAISIDIDKEMKPFFYEWNQGEGLLGLGDGQREMKIIRTNPYKLGLQIQETENRKGVKVLDVEAEKPAAQSGIKKGDIIVSIDKKMIEHIDDLLSKTKELKDGDQCNLTIERNGKSQVIELKLPRKLKTASL